MLQYPLQLPPLSLSSSKRTDDRNASTVAALARRRLLDDKLVGARQQPPIPVSFPPLSSPSSPLSSSPSSPDVSPYFASKAIPRSPRVTTPRLPSATTRSPHPLASLPSFRDSEDNSRHSSLSSVVADVLFQGDLVGEGLPLLGETITRVPISRAEPCKDYEKPAKEFEVVRKLGTGSYAVVYLVREVLSRPQSPPSDDGYPAAAGSMEMDDIRSEYRGSFEYGREYAVKLLSKANLDEDALGAQLLEATIHQSLPVHSNIVTLHRTLETPSFLLLLLEFVPGEDLFYFLEQSRDHYDNDPALSVSPSSSDSSCTSRTPPTPSLLGQQDRLLSRTRLRLIASMFTQMCEAVAVCHENSVFHRDIKPENFIVTDGWTTLPDGRRERKVIVKLSDFGLSTTDKDSADMDCGSAPYMSFECRNNIHPTYSPRAADVWSLGIVLINMLYHYNPWTDTTLGVCPSFTQFRAAPTDFLLTRFTGMTPTVADFLATRVFCLLPDHTDDSPRIAARTFGEWIRDLPALLAPARPGHARTASVSSVTGHRIASIPHSRRPSLRPGVAARVGVLDVPPSQRASKSLSRAPSLSAFREVDAEREALPSLQEPTLPEEPEQDEQEQEQEADSRSASTHKRRKRGARKGKGAAAASLASPVDSVAEKLAEASQALAREISRTSRHSSLAALPDGQPVLLDRPQTQAVQATPMPVPVAAPMTPAASISKKPSKWKLTFGKSTPPPPPPAPEGLSTAGNVANLLMSLNAPAGAPKPPASASVLRQEVVGQEADEWGRGRRARGSPYGAHAPGASATWGPASGAPFASSGSVDRRGAGRFGDSRTDLQLPGAFNGSSGNLPAQGAAGNAQGERGVSPASTRSGRPLASSANSVASSNWRSSMASVGPGSSASSAYTRYSNGSKASVSTAATSVSSGSWRSGAPSKAGSGGAPSGYPYEARPAQMPSNVKFVTGTPWELCELPRQMYKNPDTVQYSGPPTRKRRAPKPKDTKLGTISERPAHTSSPLAQRQDASTSTTDLAGPGDDGAFDGAGPRKVQKGQINALAKMLSALRR